MKLFFHYTKLISTFIILTLAVATAMDNDRKESKEERKIEAPKVTADQKESAKKEEQKVSNLTDNSSSSITLQATNALLSTATSNNSSTVTGLSDPFKKWLEEQVLTKPSSFNFLGYYKRLSRGRQSTDIRTLVLKCFDNIIKKNLSTLADVKTFKTIPEGHTKNVIRRLYCKNTNEYIDNLPIDKIDEKLSKHSGYLDLSQFDAYSLCHLDWLPDELYLYNELTPLEYLDLSQNYNIIKIPEHSLDYCPKLKCINLSELNLYEIPAHLFDFCPELEELDLGSNKLQKFDPELLKNCVSLRAIYLDKNQITQLDKNFFAPCKKMILINLGFNPLSDDEALIKSLVHYAVELRTSNDLEFSRRFLSSGEHWQEYAEKVTALSKKEQDQ